MKANSVLILAMLAISFSCQKDKGFDLPNSEGFTSKGQEILMPFKQNLMQTLTRELEKSAVEAVEVCHTDAPEILKKVAGEFNEVEINGEVFKVSLGRSSHKLRNPDNSPEEWMESYIESFKGVSGINPAEKTIVHQISSNKIAYLEPIVAGPMCMTCHGEYVDESLRKVIDEKYPQDQAVGFEPGEFRGIFWVLFEKN